MSPCKVVINECAVTIISFHFISRDFFLTFPCVFFSCVVVVVGWYLILKRESSASLIHFNVDGLSPFFSL